MHAKQPCKKIGGKKMNYTKPEMYIARSLFIALFVIFLLIVALVFFIKKFFSIKGELEESRKENEQLKAQLQLQAEGHQKELKEIREFYVIKLNEVTQAYSKAKLMYESDIRTYRSEAELYQEEAKRIKDISEAKQMGLKSNCESLKKQNLALQLQVEELQAKLEREPRLHSELNLEPENATEQTDVVQLDE